MMKKGIKAFFVLLVLVGLQQEIIGFHKSKKSLPESGRIETTKNSNQQQDTTRQTNTADTIPSAQEDTTDMSIRDTIKQDTLDSLRRDTLIEKFQQDTTGILSQDTIPEKPQIDTVLLRDTIIVRDT